MFSFFKKNKKVPSLKTEPLREYHVSLYICNYDKENMKNGFVQSSHNFDKNAVKINNFFTQRIPFSGIPAKGLDDAAKKAKDIARENIKIFERHVSLLKKENFYECTLAINMHSKYINENKQRPSLTCLGESVTLTVKAKGLDDAAKKALDFTRKNIFIDIESVS